MLLYMQTYLYKNFKDTQLIENWGNNFWQKKWFPQKLHVFQITSISGLQLALPKECSVYMEFKNLAKTVLALLYRLWLTDHYH